MQSCSAWGQKIVPGGIQHTTESGVVWLSCPLLFLFVLLVQRHDPGRGHVRDPSAAVVVRWILHSVSVCLHLAYGAPVVFAGRVVILAGGQVRLRVRHGVARGVLTPAGPDPPPCPTQAVEVPTTSPARPRPLKTGQQLLPSLDRRGQHGQDLCGELAGAAVVVVVVGGSTLPAAQVAQQRVVLVQAAEAGAERVWGASHGGGLSAAAAFSASASSSASSSTLAAGPSQAQVLTKLAVDQVLQVGRIR